MTRYYVEIYFSYTNTVEAKDEEEAKKLTESKAENDIKKDLWKYCDDSMINKVK